MQSAWRFSQVSDDLDVNRTMNLLLSFNFNLRHYKVMSVLTGRSVVSYQV